MIRTWIACLLLCCSEATPAEPASDASAFARVHAYEQARIRIINRVSPAVACMFSPGNRAGGGSGVIIDREGYGLTNYHVVAGMLDERVGEAGLSNGKIYDIDILGIDPTGDVAMFQIRDKDALPAVEMGDSDALSVGDYALAMGNPFLLAEDYTPTVTLGIISGLHRYQRGAGDRGRALRYTDCIQVDTSINPGNSGGPLFDLTGKVVGINGRISAEERQRVNVGVGYAISINQIKRFIPMLRAGLPTKHATAGFTVFDRGRDVVVDQILDDSPAYEAGLRLNDRILRFGGKAIRSANQFISLLGTYPADWPVEVIFQRREQKLKRRFRLEDMPFPKMEGGGMFESVDPYAPHSVTTQANRRAVKRAFKMYQEAVGGSDATTSLKQLQMVGTRSMANRPQARQQMKIQFIEKREEIARLKKQRTPVNIERVIRWTLLESPDSLAKQGYKVIQGDEIGDRIAVVIEHEQKDEPTFRIWFDDENGRLLRIQFQDPTTRKQTRFEYDDYRRCGGMKLPHSRRLYFDKDLYAVDQFKTIGVKG